MNYFFLIPILLISCLLSACGDDGIKTYRVSKETPEDASMSAQMPMGSDMQMPMGEEMPMGENMPASPHGGPDAQIRWKTPKGWKEMPPSQMRTASFKVPGNHGGADVSVVRLSGEAGGDLDNINRWRGQIGLEAVSEVELPGLMQMIKPGDKTMHFVNFVSRNALAEGGRKKRLMVAYYHDGSQTWFFKMTGEDADVQAANSSFLKFLSSLRFENEQP